MGPLSRDEWIVAVAFALMVTGWVMAGTLNLNLTAVAFGGLAVLLTTGVLTADDIAAQGSTLTTFLWLAVLFALSSQLNELGFMSYVGDRLTSLLGGIPGRSPTWRYSCSTSSCTTSSSASLHRCWRSSGSSSMSAFGAGYPAALMGFALLFASSYFSVITPQGGSQNVIFVTSGYLTQGELYRLGALTTIFCVLVFLVIGTPWLLLVTR